MGYEVTEFVFVKNRMAGVFDELSLRGENLQFRSNKVILRTGLELEAKRNASRE